MNILGVGTPVLGEQASVEWSAMVPLDSASVSSYRLSIVTMPLTEAVWPQFAVQVFGGAVSNLIWGNRGL